MRSSRSRKLRDQVLPAAGPELGYSRVLLLGTTGSGKTTLIRQLVGTTGEKFPATSSSKTTTVDTEIVSAAGDYYAVATFMSRDEVLNLIEDNLVAAAVSMASGRPDFVSVSKLFEHELQRFRLPFLLGDPGPGPSWDEPYAGIFTQLGSAVQRIRPALTERDDALLGDLLRADEEVVDLADRLVAEVERRLYQLPGGELRTTDSTWPDLWFTHHADRGAFFAALEAISSNDVRRFGHLVTPIVNGLRIRGPLGPAWSDALLLMCLTDSEGLGHTAETVSSLPADLVERFDEVECIVLVDNARQPMQAASQAVLRRIATAGYLSKLCVCFTHLDEVVGPNLRWDHQRRALLHQSLEQALDPLADLAGPTGRALLKRLADERTFFVGSLQRKLDPPTDKATVDELRRLVMHLRRVEEADSRAVGPIIPAARIPLLVEEALAEFRARWLSLLGLTPPGPIVHWSQVRALCRSVADGISEEHGQLRPVAELAAIVSERVLGADAHGGWESRPSTEFSAEFLRAVNREVLRGARRHLVEDVRDLWRDAAVISGTGSTRVRALRLIDDVFRATTAPLTHSPLFWDLVDAIGRLALDHQMLPNATPRHPLPIAPAGPPRKSAATGRARS